jgi:hypothetical protein
MSVFEALTRDFYGSLSINCDMEVVNRYIDTQVAFSLKRIEFLFYYQTI